MERPALELTEVFEEDGYKGSDILGAVLGRVLKIPHKSMILMQMKNTYDMLAIVSVRVANADGLRGMKLVDI